jgi:hypothetical protein
MAGLWFIAGLVLAFIPLALRAEILIYQGASVDDVQGMDRHIRVKGRIYILIDRDTSESVAVEYGTGATPGHGIRSAHRERIVLLPYPYREAVLRW